MKRGWSRDGRVGAALIRRARAVVSATLRGTPVPGAALPSDLIPVRIHGVGVTLYSQRMLGCWIGLGSDLDVALARGAARAARDPRYPPVPASRLSTLRIAVSVLYEPRRFGPCRKKHVAQKLRLGFNTLGVSTGKHFAMVLESAAPHHSLTRLQLAAALLRKAHLTDRPIRWTAYATASWLEADRGVRRLQCGFCLENSERITRGTLRADLAQMAQFLMSTLTSTGPRYYALNPITGLTVTHGTAEQAAIAYAGLRYVGRFLSRRSWQRRGLQGLQTIRSSKRDRAEVEAILEIADAWVDQQDRSTGAFRSDEEADGLPSRTPYVAITIADAWTLALACGQRRRARRYERSWLAAISFARQLIVRGIDAPMLREPVRSVGGVRISKANALVTIDAVGHLLIAMVKGLEMMESPGSCKSASHRWGKC